MSLDIAIRHRFGDFSLDVAFRGDRPGVTALFGPSGAGKSSIVQAIAGLLRPDAGRIVVDGETLFDSTAGRNVAARHRRIGYVFQDARLFPHLSVRSNLLFGARRRHRTHPTEPFEAIVALLGIGALLDRRPRDLSGGERQRVALGRALLSDPRLLLLDEPLAALDQNRRAEIMPYLERLRDEARIPMLYVSHAIDEVARLADDIVVVDRGRAVAHGSVFDVMARLDLFPITGRFDAGAVVDARIDAQERQDRMTSLVFDSGRLWVPAIDAPVGSPVRVRIRARDIMLALDEPQRISANNVVAATIAEIRSDPDGSIDVQLACGKARLVAQITQRSRARLALAPGMPVFAVVKSVTIDRRSLADGDETDARRG
jgi:molybdate transport system ATP-binding protein